MAIKLIISNFDALKQKYSAQVASIQEVLKEVIAADSKAGINTQVIYIDKEEEMKAADANAVTVATDCEQNKKAIDALYKHYKPDYLLLLGAPDIIPHQRLENPAPDDDPDVPSDLPYACDAAYSTKITNFLTPTRLVSRLPDITGIPAKNSDYFVSVLRFAAQQSQRPLKDYLNYFSVSCYDWKKSTALSLKAIFTKNEGALYSSPLSGPDWSVDQLAPLSHFINCHGAPENPNFFGQKGKKYPVAMSASLLSNKLKPDTVVAAECCYGAQLYNPKAQSPAVHMGICNTYLLKGAKAYFGSANIAWGRPKTNSCADLITQYFMSAMLAGNSVGQAVLTARLTFIRNEDLTRATVLKTLASFNSMGDPSRVPVAHAAGNEPEPHSVIALSHHHALAHSQALAITSGAPYSERDDARGPSETVQKVIDDMLANRKVQKSKQQTRVVHWPSTLQKSAITPPGVLVHAIGFHDPDQARAAPFESHVIVEIKESADRVISVEEYRSK